MPCYLSSRVPALPSAVCWAVVLESKSQRGMSPHYCTKILLFGSSHHRGYTTSIGTDLDLPSLSTLTKAI